MSGQTTETDIETVERVSGTGIPLRGNDIDTDQIIPARYLKAVTFDGLGQFAFQDQRFTDDDEPKDHPFNEDRFRDASVLVVNANFGCGSSREHAPQALMRWGIDAIVGESFAEIFAGNCLALGIPTVTAEQDEIETLQAFVDENPDAEIDVDVTAETVSYDGTEIDAAVDDAQRKALVEGVWDTTALLGSNPESVAQTARDLPYVEEAE
ncbi:3-isopropylmalate dehydratase small subunit [Halorussus sp. MSC15.2]|uniref:3-isopropylmalate dehydratase small subunit n=1 Tax=Halorussus sp. MSC15.2 TaxID=2283638 RepID=UPI0013D7B9C0|nr:3-isopropylmalate dehydratase small subunit [Halorussus sp. MSC15.2]NEU59026.1 3-isopropylmalate dehydratase small subunit [Halorussus sp. MSC15.2]